eukprot:8815189-Alexandrium_andersonii.AAC.1
MNSGNSRLRWPMGPSMRVSEWPSVGPWATTTCCMLLIFGTDVLSMPMRAVMGRGWACHFLSPGAWGCCAGKGGSRARV